MTDNTLNDDLKTTVASEPADERDLGFGSVVAGRSRQRLLNADGTFNVERTGLSIFTSLNPYHTLLSMSWSTFLGLVLLLYFLSNIVFGMLYASIERAPWRGAVPRRSQDAMALAVPSVRLIPCSIGIAVVANTTWAALKGRTALAVDWGDPPKDAFESEGHFKRLAQSAEQKGIITRKEDPPGGNSPTVRTIYATYFYPF